MLPDAAQQRLVEVGVEEVAGADRGVAVRQRPVRQIDERGDALRHRRRVRVEPAAQQSLDRRLAGEERTEPEAPPQRRVEQRDRAVGGVHRAHEEQVLREPERLAAVLERHRLLAVFEQEVEFAEHLRDVAAVEFVDHEHVLRARVRLGLGGDAAQRAAPQLERRLPVAGQRGAVALDEVLVGVRGVELHDLEPAARGLGVLPRDPPRDERLPGARRPVEDQLPLVLEVGHDLLELAGLPHQLLADGGPVRLARRLAARGVLAVLVGGGVLGDAGCGVGVAVRFAVGVEGGFAIRRHIVRVIASHGYAPDERLRVEPVFDHEAALRRLRDELVEERDGVFVLGSRCGTRVFGHAVRAPERSAPVDRMSLRPVRHQEVRGQRAVGPAAVQFPERPRAFRGRGPFVCPEDVQRLVGFRRIRRHELLEVLHGHPEEEVVLGRGFSQQFGPVRVAGEERLAGRRQRCGGFQLVVALVSLEPAPLVEVACPLDEGVPARGVGVRLLLRHVRPLPRRSLPRATARPRRGGRWRGRRRPRRRRRGRGPRWSSP